MSLVTVEEHKSFGGLQGVYRHPANATACEMEFSVYVPPQVNAGAVVYYLSGLTCSQENVTTKGGFQRYAAEHGLIVVCPDTSPRGAGYPGEDDDYDFGTGAGFYVDATVAPWSGMYRMYTYIVEEFPALIAKHFPVDTARAGLFGHSMGGHGALTLALRNPGMYRSVSAFAPIVAPTQCPWGEKALRGYLGDDRVAWDAYDATELVKSGHTTGSMILIDQGTADPFLEAQLKTSLFQQACDAAGQAVTVRLQDGYDHSYYLMSTFMGDHIRHHADQLTGYCQS